MVIEAAQADGESFQVWKGAYIGRLVKDLEALPRAEIESFQAWQDAYRYAADRKELWAAAGYICGGCGDDGFDYFRGWLIAQGQAVFEAAVRDPGSLARHRWPGSDKEFPEAHCEWMLSVARTAYSELTNEEMPWDQELPGVPGREDWPVDRIADYDWTDEDTLKLFPALGERWPRTDIDD